MYKLAFQNMDTRDLFPGFGNQGAQIESNSLHGRSGDKIFLLWKMRTVSCAQIMRTRASTKALVWF
jgi:hypothetical protein